MGRKWGRQAASVGRKDGCLDEWAACAAYGTHILLHASLAWPGTAPSFSLNKPSDPPCFPTLCAADESPFAVRPRIYAALPLPLGATSACEWLELTLTERLEAEAVCARLQVGRRACRGWGRVGLEAGAVDQYCRQAPCRWHSAGTTWQLFVLAVLPLVPSHPSPANNTPPPLPLALLTTPRRCPWPCRPTLCRRSCRRAWSF